MSLLKRLAFIPLVIGTAFASEDTPVYQKFVAKSPSLIERLKQETPTSINISSGAFNGATLEGTNNVHSLRLCYTGKEVKAEYNDRTTQENSLNLSYLPKENSYKESINFEYQETERTLYINMQTLELTDIFVIGPNQARLSKEYNLLIEAKLDEALEVLEKGKPCEK